MIVSLAQAPTPSLRPGPPAPPSRKAPTAIFRELLAASPAERERQLASRSPAARALIETKLREFEVLPPEPRELRLRVAELQFFLLPLLRVSPTSRPALLAEAPAEVQPLLEERLRAWEGLSREQQQELLDSQRSLAWFVRLQSTSARSFTNLLAQVPAADRAELESQLGRWRSLTTEDRVRKTADFQRFFELSPEEQNKVLREISPEERRQMEATLVRFSQMPPEQRARAVRGFRQLFALTAPDRAEFFQNSAEWQAMTPAERTAWRKIVARVTAPPPMPPEPRFRRHLVSTNTL